MAKHAKVLEPTHVRRLLVHARHYRYPQRNTVMILLSFKAGLRACEIAGLDWRMVLRPDGKVADLMHVENTIAKNGGGRKLPINPELKKALQRLLRDSPRPAGPVIRSERGDHMRPHSIVCWFRQLYQVAGLNGCSSHSGRRTFITRSARIIAKTGGSLRDVQLLAGHASIETTQGYIEGNAKAQRHLINLV